MSSIERCPRCGATSPVVHYGICGGCPAQVGRNPKGGDAKLGSVEDEHAVAEGDAPDTIRSDIREG